MEEFIDGVKNITTMMTNMGEEVKDQILMGIVFHVIPTIYKSFRLFVIGKERIPLLDQLINKLVHEEQQRQTIFGRTNKQAFLFQIG